MPRPLKILKGIVEQDPSATRYRINELLGETVAIAEDALKQLTTCLRLLLSRDQASEADPCIFDLGVRFWNDIRAANMLISEGLVLHATMMQRIAMLSQNAERQVQIPPQFPEKLSGIVEEFAVRFHENRDVLDLLPSLTTLCYVVTGNGYFLYQTGRLTI